LHIEPKAPVFEPNSTGRFSSLCDLSEMKNIQQIMLICLVVGSSALGNAQSFTLKSKDLEGQFNGKQISNTFGCTGDNESPQLNWTNPPEGTKSFAVTMYDQDAPTGSGWWHWSIFNLPANTTEIVRGAGNANNHLLPAGAMLGNTDFGVTGYGGPCPPEGDKPHAYVITVWALKIAKLGPDEHATPALVGFLLNQHVIAKTSLIIYSRR
jgi:Raf kinase inhibitor-like YbhB/YbcL family protein